MGLQKNMSVSQGVVLAICTLVGSGLLGLPGLAVEEGGVTASVLGWIISILISVPLVLVFFDLSLKAKSAGGIATYAKYAFGDWAETAVSYMLIASFLFGMPIGTYMSAMFLQSIFQLDDNYLMSILFGLMGLMTLSNYFGLRPAAWLNTVSVASLLIFIALVIGIHWKYLPDGLSVYISTFSNIFHGMEVSWNKLWSVCAVLFWAFIGWENMSFSSEEIEGKSNIDGSYSNDGAIKQIYIYAFLLVSFIYLALAVLTAGAIYNGVKVNGVTGILILLQGTVVAKLAYALIVFVILANGNAWVYAGSRLLYASGKQKILPSYLARLSNSKSGEGVPRASLLTLFAMFTVMSVIIYFDWVPLAQGIALISQNFIVVYILSIICYIKMNKSSVLSWLIGLSALLSCGFLLLGFGWLILIPLVILWFGWLIHKIRIK